MPAEPGPTPTGCSCPQMLLVLFGQGLGELPMAVSPRAPPTLPSKCKSLGEEKPHVGVEFADQCVALPRGLDLKETSVLTQSRPKARASQGTSVYLCTSTSCRARRDSVVDLLPSQPWQGRTLPKGRCKLTARVNSPSRKDYDASVDVDPWSF